MVEKEDAFPIGTVILYYGTTPPKKYIWADGSIVLFDIYPELGKVLGYTSGTITLPTVTKGVIKTIM